MMRVGLLVSGSGTNLQAILEAAAQGDLNPALPALVISNRPDAPALERARRAGIETLVVDHRPFLRRADFDRALTRALRQHQIDLVALAGFMRIVGPELLSAFPDRVVNIHPSLLPSFPGLHAQRQALLYGAKISGCTVHFVDDGIDSGPIIAQAAVEVQPHDDEAALSARILAQEHLLYPRVLRALAEGRVHRDGRRAWIRP